MNLRDIFGDDKRLTELLYPENQEFRIERVSEKEWHYCKYCHEDAPTFLFLETQREPGVTIIEQVLRCCWQCGAGLEIVEESKCKS